MSATDCPKCWDTPCTCGYEYRKWKLERLTKFVSTLQAVLVARGEDGSPEVSAAAGALGKIPPRARFVMAVWASHNDTDGIDFFSNCAPCDLVKASQALAAATLLMSQPPKEENQT